MVIEELQCKMCLFRKTEIEEKKNKKWLPLYTHECETVQFLVGGNIEPSQKDLYAAGCVKVQRESGWKWKRYKNSGYGTFWHDKRIVC